MVACWCRCINYQKMQISLLNDSVCEPCRQIVVGRVGRLCRVVQLWLITQGKSAGIRLSKLQNVCKCSLVITAGF